MKRRYSILANSPFTAFALGTCLSSCIIHADSHTHRSGSYVSAETLRQVEPGKTTEYVLSLLGEPSTRSKLSDGVEIWKWTYTERRTSSGSLIFIIDTDETHETSNATYVEFKDGRVTKAWRD